MRQFENYRVTRSSAITAELWNRVIGDMDARTARTEDTAQAVDRVVEELKEFTLVRVDTIIQGPLQEFLALMAQAQDKFDNLLGVTISAEFIAETPTKQFVTPQFTATLDLRFTTLGLQLQELENAFNAQRRLTVAALYLGGL